MARHGIGISRQKAGTILRHGMVRGRRLTRRQRGLFGLVRGGSRPSRLRRR